MEHCTVASLSLPFFFRELQVAKKYYIAGKRRLLFGRNGTCVHFECTKEGDISQLHMKKRLAHCLANRLANIEVRALPLMQYLCCVHEKRYRHVRNAGKLHSFPSKAPKFSIRIRKSKETLFEYRKLKLDENSERGLFSIMPSYFKVPNPLLLVKRDICLASFARSMNSAPPPDRVSLEEK